MKYSIDPHIAELPVATWETQWKDNVDMIISQYKCIPLSYLSVDNCIRAHAEAYSIIDGFKLNNAQLENQLKCHLFDMLIFSYNAIALGQSVDPKFSAICDKRLWYKYPEAKRIFTRLSEEVRKYFKSPRLLPRIHHILSSTVGLSREVCWLTAHSLISREEFLWNYSGKGNTIRMSRNQRTFGGGITVIEDPTNPSNKHYGILRDSHQDGICTTLICNWNYPDHGIFRINTRINVTYKSLVNKRITRSGYIRERKPGDNTRIGIIIS